MPGLIRDSVGCAGCGKCCEIIGIRGLTMDRVRAEIAALLPRADRLSFYEERSLENLRFISQHWNEIPEAAAWRLDPERCGQTGTGWFTCSRYDPAAHVCLAHADKPPVCRDFPWYGGEPRVGQIPHDQCSYWRDVPEAEWPAGVRPLPVSVC